MASIKEILEKGKQAVEKTKKTAKNVATALVDPMANAPAVGTKEESDVMNKANANSRAAIVNSKDIK